MNRLTRLPDLPSWANNPEGRALVARILDEQPDYRITPGQWIDGGQQREYRGKAVSGLRRLFNAELERLGNLETKAWLAGKPWEQFNIEVNELLAQERPDALVQRLLEPVSFVEVSRSGTGVWL
jgi:hypothetical protein